MSDLINATLDIAYFDARDALSDLPAQVRLDARGLTLVAVDDKGETVLWHGERRGQGHYVLSSPEAGMEGSLHRFADSRILEGFWRKGRERGFWRLQLPQDVASPLQAAVGKPPGAAAKARARPVRRRRIKLAA